MNPVEDAPVTVTAEVLSDVTRLEARTEDAKIPGVLLNAAPNV